MHHIMSAAMQKAKAVGVWRLWHLNGYCDFGVHALICMQPPEFISPGNRLVVRVMRPLRFARVHSTQQRASGGELEDGAAQSSGVAKKRVRTHGKGWGRSLTERGEALRLGGSDSSGAVPAGRTKHLECANPWGTHRSAPCLSRVGKPT